MPGILANQVDKDAEAIRLLSIDYNVMERNSLAPTASEGKTVAHVETTYTDDSGQSSSAVSGPGVVEEDSARINGYEARQKYRVYKIRWLGLVQLVLLNIVVSWDVSLFFFREHCWVGIGRLLYN